MNIQLKQLQGDAISGLINELANLRMEVFKEFPYLYDGSAEYEKEILKTYLNNREAMLIVAFDADKVIGASTAIPLTGETDEVKKPFIEHNIPLEEVFYFGESVLLRPYRGKGIGRRFMQLREQHAANCGYKYASFCAVVRPEFHALKPENYRNLEGFWMAQGFTKQNHMRTAFYWKDLDKPAEDEKEMVFWLKHLNPSG